MQTPSAMCLSRVWKRLDDMFLTPPVYCCCCCCFIQLRLNPLVLRQPSINRQFVPYHPGVTVLYRNVVYLVRTRNDNNEGCIWDCHGEMRVVCCSVLQCAVCMHVRIMSLGYVTYPPLLFDKKTRRDQTTTARKNCCMQLQQY